jgi:hypothetical protein
MNMDASCKSCILSFAQSAYSDRARRIEEERERGWDEQREGEKGKERCIRVEK